MSDDVAGWWCAACNAWVDPRSDGACATCGAQHLQRLTATELNAIRGPDGLPRWAGEALRRYAADWPPAQRNGDSE
jgi:hypothetical protein